MNPQYIDISGYQTPTPDWNAYAQWSRAGDGVARVCIKASEGWGFTDKNYYRYRTDARASGVNAILHYHFARPDLNAEPEAEADWFLQVVGALPPQDLIMLDYEVSDPRGQDASWVLRWLDHVAQVFGKERVGVYASTSRILSTLQNPSLGNYGLVEANWGSVLPPVPPPWKSRWAWQFTDNARVPGFGDVPIDCNVYLGGSMGIPTGWSDDGQHLKAPNGRIVVFGFRDYVINYPGGWNAANVPLDEERHVDPLEYSNPALGAGQKQFFLRSTLEWTPNLGVFEGAQGQELKKLNEMYSSAQTRISAQDIQIASLKSQVATLTQQLADCQAGSSAITPELQDAINTAFNALSTVSSPIVAIEDKLKPFVKG